MLTKIVIFIFSLAISALASLSCFEYIQNENFEFPLDMNKTILEVQT